MKRAGRLWPCIVRFDNLAGAARRAARGKRTVAGVARFLADLEPELLRVQRELERETWRPGRAYRFRISDPKPRTITAAPFEDRVVHQALIGVLEPHLDRRMLHESFACRRGKGTHAALRHARRAVRRFDWFLKLDVARCFDSLRHDVVLSALGRVVKDARVLRLGERIVAVGGREGVGLPIGNLTSQWFANLVLDRLDHHVKERLGIAGYVRYMDDFVLFGDTKERLREAHGEVERFLARELSLTLKARATILAPTSQGLPFLGWRIQRGVTRIRPGNLHRMRTRVRARIAAFHAGRLEEEALIASLRSVCEHLRHGGTLALRRGWFEGPAAWPRPRAPP